MPRGRCAAFLRFDKEVEIDCARRRQVIENRSLALKSGVPAELGARYTIEPVRGLGRLARKHGLIECETDIFTVLEPKPFSDTRGRFFVTLRDHQYMLSGMTIPFMKSDLPARFRESCVNHGIIVRSRQAISWGTAVTQLLSAGMWLGFAVQLRDTQLLFVQRGAMLDTSCFAANSRQRQEGILLKVFDLRYRLAFLARNSTDE
jgi:hypothetical protein